MSDVMKDYLTELDSAVKAIPLDKVRQLAELIYETSQKGRTVYLFGNGDSANNAFNFACDLSKGTITKGKKRMRLVCLNENVAVMTAWGNDESFESIFKQQLENLAVSGDLVIGITTSGNSPNVLRAFEYANSIGLTTVSLTAFQGGKAKALSKHCIIAKTNNIEVAEAVHWIISDLIKYYLIEKMKK